MNWYGGGFIPIIIYSNYSSNTVIPITGELLLTDETQFLLTDITFLLLAGG